MFNDPGGVNLYKDVHVDYRLSEITSEILSDILLGNQSASAPVVLGTSSSDNILFFTSGHGAPDGMIFSGREEERLTPEYWSSLFRQMHDANRFRRIFWSMESCYSGKIGEAITTPGVLIMTGANPYETSKAYLYEGGLGV